VEIFFQKYILTLQPNGEPLTFAFFFIFWVYVCSSIFKKNVWLILENDWDMQNGASVRSTLAFRAEVADGMKMQWSVGIGSG
jgi:hypothetical protein